MAGGGWFWLATVRPDGAPHVMPFASHIRDQATLQHAVEAFQTVYGWPTRIDGNHLDADYGAPTSGGPPYEVYEVTPIKAFGLPTDGESIAPTRWTRAEYG